jgi:hypothetical protein
MTGPFSRLRSLSLETALVVATALGLSLFVWKRAFVHEPHLFPLKLPKAIWIQVPGGGSANGYFRKELFVPLRVKDAWMRVAAADSGYLLLVNGREVGKQEQPQRNVAGVFDLGPYLSVGKNVIALRVRAATFDRPAMAAVEGGYRDAEGRTTTFWSDDTWTATSHYESQANFTIPWTDPRFLPPLPESRAEAVKAPPRSAPLLVVAHPDLYEWPTPSTFMAFKEPGSTSAVFSREFEVSPQPPEGAWLRVVAPREAYAVALNGITLFGRSAASGPPELHDITPYLLPGRNAIDVRVMTAESSPELALDLVLAQGDRTQIALSSGSSWRVRGAMGAWNDFGRATGPSTEPAVNGGDTYWPLPRLAKTLVSDPLPNPHLLKRLESGGLLVLGMLVIAFLDWMVMGRLLRAFHPDLDPSGALRADALLRLPVLVLLGLVYLLKYDIRFDPAYPFRWRWILASLLVLLLLRLCLVVALRFRGAGEAPAPEPRAAMGPVKAALVIACLAALVTVGESYRVHKALVKSLDHDELSMVFAAEAIPKWGYPLREIGPTIKPLTTYELLPWPMAASMTIFGKTPFAFRVPAMVFAALTTLLVFFIGFRIWGPGTGLLAATLHTFSPFGIYWGSDAFHPQQAQFFALLTSYQFFRALGGPTPADFKARPAYYTALAFGCTYLSWEGTGLLLPAMFVALLVRYGKDWRWVKNPHLWGCTLLCGTLIATQLGRRSLLTFTYSTVGNSLANSSVCLAFKRIIFDPWFYAHNFYFPGHHIALTLVLLAGLPIVFKDQGLRYYVTILVSLTLLLQEFVLPESVRYSFFLQPFLLLSASAIITTTVSLLKERASLGFPLRAATAVFAAGAAAFVLLSTNDFVLKPYRIGYYPYWVAPDVTPEWGGLDYAGASAVIREHKIPDDYVLALMPHTLFYYAGVHADGYPQSYTNRLLFYDLDPKVPHYMDRYGGSRVLRNAHELAEALAKHHRAWILATPEYALGNSNDKECLDFLAANARVVYESYGVLVYFWQH